MAHQCDCDFEAGKTECEEIEQMFFFIICILFTTQYNQNIHNEGQRHIIVQTDLTTEMWTDFESFLQQILLPYLIFTCFI